MGGMTPASTWWSRWWFPPVPEERVAVFRILVTGFALVDVTLVSNYMFQYSTVDRSFFEPVLLLELLGLVTDPVPSPGGHRILYAVMVAALLASFVGYRTRLALLVAAPLYLYHWSLFNSWGKVNHGKIPAVIALLVLVVAPAAYRYSVDALRRRRSGRGDAGPVLDPLGGWVLRIVGVTVVGAYLLSVLAKLMNAGPTWPLQPVVASELLIVDGPIAQALVERPELLVVAQAVTMLAEVAAVLAFVGGWPRNIVLAVLAMFHLSSYALLETEFTGFLVCYAVFFRLEEIPPALRAIASSRSRTATDVG